MSSAPHSLPLWGHTIQCVCACPSGLSSYSVFISFYVFPHFFYLFFFTQCPSYPTVRLRGNRRFYSQCLTPLWWSVSGMFTCSHSRHNQSPLRLPTCVLQWLHFNRFVGSIFIVYLSGFQSPHSKCRVTGVMLIYPLPASGGYI